MTNYQPFKRTINYYETDRMQVVHHSNYIRFLEECRMDFMKQIDLDYNWMEEHGVMIPVLSVECDYRTPARFGDTICIVPKLEKFSRVKFEMTYQIYSEDFSFSRDRSAEYTLVISLVPSFIRRNISAEYPPDIPFISLSEFLICDISSSSNPNVDTRRMSIRFLSL